MATLLGTAGSSAAAENTISTTLPGQSGVTDPAAKTMATAPTGAGYATTGTPTSPLQSAPSAPAIAPSAVAAASLEQLVATQAESAQVAPGELTDQLKCLAGAIYFEARSESLEGQLAVGRVIVARTRSGRFPASYCGVVYQHSQFSFVRGAAMPSVDSQSHLWHRAVALAKIADAGSWQSPAEGALYFHAARVGAGSGFKRVAQIDHHIFYR